LKPHNLLYLLKISEAISKATESVSNTLDRRVFIDWLSRLDWQIKTEILDNYTDEIEYNGYEEDTDENTELLISAPYDELYIRYLEAQIHRYYEDINKYNNCIAEYNAIYNKFRAQYNRTHKHKGATRYRFYGGT
jgi:hypothetical protein